VYLSATVFTLFEPITAKWRLFRGGEVPLFDALVRGEPLHPVARNFVTIFVTINYRPWGSPQWRFRDPSLHLFDTDHECDRQTDGQTPRRWQRRAKHSAVARKKLAGGFNFSAVGARPKLWRKFPPEHNLTVCYGGWENSWGFNSHPPAIQRLSHVCSYL